MMRSFVKRVLDVQTSFSKGVYGEADVPRMSSLSRAGDRHVILPHEEASLDAAELIVFAGRFLGESMEKARRMSACAPKTPHGAVLLDASPPDPTGTQPTGPILSRIAGEDGACNQPDEGQPPTTPWVST